MIQRSRVLYFLGVFTIVAASACSSATVKSIEPVDSVTTSGGTDTVVVNNAPDLYSERFIEALRKSGIANKYTLQKDIILRDDTVQSYFDNYLELKKEYVVYGCVGKTCYNLWISRISNTTIKYLLEERVDNGAAKTLKGEADLLPGFLLGSESDEAEDGESYEVSEYVDASNCNLSIRIGRTGGDNLKGRISKRCEDGSSELKLEDSPFLVEHN